MMRAVRTVVAASWVLAIGTPSTGAAPVGQFAVEGIVLGASLDFVLDRFPTMFVEEIEYEDPVVGLRYKPYLASSAQRFIDRIVGRIQVSTDQGLLMVRATFTGRRELFELLVIREDSGVDCEAEMAQAATRWGKPDTSDGASLAQWIEQEFDVYRRLDLQCFPESGLQSLLIDEALPARHRSALRAALAPYVEQALLQGGG